jgi:ubiquinol-cytochrome c reductase cytochrome b subunit
MNLRLSISLLIVVCSSVALASSRSQRARGAAVFQVSGCQHCHTIRNVGGHKGPDLSGVGRRMPKAALRQQIVYGSKVMPAFGEVLKPDEINDLIAYLHSCREKSAKAAPAPGSN